MIIKIIKNVSGLTYVSHQEIADAKNGKQIISQCDNQQEIPLVILDFGKDEQIVLAGEAALYPWVRGQRVEVGMLHSAIWTMKYLRELQVRGIDTRPYQDIVIYDSIKPISQGKVWPEEDAVEFKGIGSFEIFTKLAEVDANPCEAPVEFHNTLITK